MKIDSFRSSVGLLMVSVILAGCNGLSPTDLAIQHYVNAMEQRDSQKALAELRKAIQADPTLSIAHSTMGDIYRREGNYQEAARAYEKACQTNPYAFHAHYNLGVTYKFLADAAKTAQAAAEYLRKAIEVYLRAIMLKPDDFDANLNLSACYFEMGKYDLAKDYCIRAIRINPKNPYAHANLGIIYEVQNKPYQAIRAYRNSLELDTHQPKLMLNLGTTYLRLGRVKEALRVFELAVKEDQKCWQAWERIGACYYKLQKWDRALDAYKKAVDINPNSATGYRGLGAVIMTKFILAGRKDTTLRDKALQMWYHSLEINPDQPDINRLIKKYSPPPARVNL